MRIGLVLLPLAACAAPLAAQPARAPMPVPPQQRMQVPPELLDPATTDHMVDALQVMSKVFLDLPVGDVEAALEGRKPTAAEHRETVRSQTGMSEQQLNARIAAAKPMLRQSMRAMVQALPQLMQTMEGMAGTMERAMANMPDPNYPRR